MYGDQEGDDVDIAVAVAVDDYQQIHEVEAREFTLPSAPGIVFGADLTSTGGDVHTRLPPFAAEDTHPYRRSGPGRGDACDSSSSRARSGGISCVAAAAAATEEDGFGQFRDDCIACLLVADGRVGTTSSIRRFLGEELIDLPRPAVLDHLSTDIDVDGKRLKVEIYDLPSAHENRTLRNMVYQLADVVMICFSLENRATLNSALLFWLPEVIESVARTVPILLVGTHGEKFAAREGRKSFALSSKLRQASLAVSSPNDDANELSAFEASTSRHVASVACAASRRQNQSRGQSYGDLQSQSRSMFDQQQHQHVDQSTADGAYSVHWATPRSTSRISDSSMCTTTTKSTTRARTRPQRASSSSYSSLSSSSSSSSTSTSGSVVTSVNISKALAFANDTLTREHEHWVSQGRTISDATVAARHRYILQSIRKMSSSSTSTPTASSTSSSTSSSSSANAAAAAGGGGGAGHRQLMSLMPNAVPLTTLTAIVKSSSSPTSSSTSSSTSDSRCKSLLAVSQQALIRILSDLHPRQVDNVDIVSSVTDEGVYETFAKAILAGKEHALLLSRYLERVAEENELELEREREAKMVMGEEGESGADDDDDNDDNDDAERVSQHDHIEDINDNGRVSDGDAYGTAADNDERGSSSPVERGSRDSVSLPINPMRIDTYSASDKGITHEGCNISVSGARTRPRDDDGVGTVSGSSRRSGRGSVLRRDEPDGADRKNAHHPAGSSCVIC